MFTGNLFVLCGPPRGGKTTFANKWRLQTSNRIVINIDSFRFALTGCRYNTYGESLALAAAETAAKAFLFNGLDVLIDDTNSTDENLIRWLRIDNKVKFIPLNKELVDSSFSVDAWNKIIETCIERAINTNQSDLINVIKRVGYNLSILLPNFTKKTEELRSQLKHKYCIQQ